MPRMEFVGSTWDSQTVLRLGKVPGVRNGDLLIMLVENGTAAFTMPAGWTSLYASSVVGAGTNPGGGNIGWRIASNEPDFYEITGDSYMIGTVLAYRNPPADPILGFSVTNASAPGHRADIPNLPSEVDGTLVAAVSGSSGEWTTPPGMEFVNFIQTNIYNTMTVWQTQSGAGQTGVRTSYADRNLYSTVQFAVSLRAAGPPPVLPGAVALQGESYLASPPARHGAVNLAADSKVAIWPTLEPGPQRLPPATNQLRMTGTWTPSAPLAAGVDEDPTGPQDTDTYTCTPSSTNGDNAFRAGMRAPVKTPRAGTQHQVRIQHNKSASGGKAVLCAIEVRQGATVIASFTATDAELGDIATQPKTYTLTAAQAASITNYSTLEVQVSPYTSGGGGGRDYILRSMDLMVGGGAIEQTSGAHLVGNATLTASAATTKPPLKTENASANLVANSALFEATNSVAALSATSSLGGVTQAGAPAVQAAAVPLTGTASLAVPGENWAPPKLPILSKVVATASQKVSATSLLINTPDLVVGTGDYVLVHFGSDVTTSTTGAVTVAVTGTAGTEAFVANNITNGSGEPGVRGVALRTRVTAAGTLTSFTVNYPTAVAVAAEVIRVTGATKVAGFKGEFGPGSGPLSVSLSTPLGDYDNVIGCTAARAPATATVATSTQAGVTVNLTETATSGTSGGTAASNTTVSYVEFKIENIPSGVTSLAADSLGVSGNAAVAVYLLAFASEPVTAPTAKPSGQIWNRPLPNTVAITQFTTVSAKPAATYTLWQSPDNEVFTKVKTVTTGTGTPFRMDNLERDKPLYYFLTAENIGGFTRSDTWGYTPQAFVKKNSFDGGIAGQTFASKFGLTGGVSGDGFTYIEESTGANRYTYTDLTRKNKGLALRGTFDTQPRLGWRRPKSEIFYGRMYVKSVVRPSASFLLNGESNHFIYLETTGAVRLSGQTQVTSTTILPLNQWVRIEYMASQPFKPEAPTDSQGQCIVRIYADADSDVITEEISTGLFGALDDFFYFDAGSNAVSTDSGETHLDDVGVSTLNWLGPAPEPILGQANLVATSQLQASATATSGVTEATGAVGLAASSSLSATGATLTTVSGAVALAGSATLTTATVVQTSGSTTLAASSSLQSGGSVTVTTASSLSATSSLGSTVTLTTPAAAGLSAGSTLAVAGSTQVQGGAALSGGSTLSVGVAAVLAAEAGLVASSALQAPAVASTTGVAALAADSTLTTSATAQVLASVALSATSTLTPSSTLAVTAPSSLQADSSLGVSAAVTTSGSVALTATSTMSAASLVTTTSAVALTAGGTLAVAAGGSVLADATTLSATSTLTLTATVAVSTPVGLQAASTLTVSAVSAVQATTALQAGSTLSVSADGQISGNSDLVATSALQAEGTRTQFATSTFAGAGSLTASASLLVSAEAALTSTSTFGSTSTGTVVVGVALSAASSMGVGGAVTSDTSGSLLATSSLSAGSLVIVVGGAALAAGSTFGVTAAVTTVGAVALTAGSTLSSTGTRGTLGAVDLVAGSTLTSGAVSQSNTATTLTASSSLTAGHLVTVQASAILSGASSFSGGADRTAVAAASLTGSSGLSASGAHLISGESALVGSSSLTTAGFIQALAGVTLSAGSTLGSTGLTTVWATVTLTANSAFLSPVIVEIHAQVTLTAGSSLSAGGRSTSNTASDMEAVSSLTSAANVLHLGQVVLGGTSSLLSSGFALTSALGAMVANALLQAEGGRATTGGASLMSGATLVVFERVVTGGPGVVSLSITARKAADVSVKTVEVV